jgi:hypothetical protein
VVHPNCSYKLNKVIRIVHSILEFRNFKVAQRHSTGDFLVVCSASDANILNGKVKRLRDNVVSFYKLEELKVLDNEYEEISGIRDATEGEFKCEIRQDYFVRKRKYEETLKRYFLFCLIFFLTSHPFLFHIFRYNLFS